MIWYDLIWYDMKRTLPTEVRIKGSGFNWAPCCEEMEKFWLVAPSILNVSSRWTWVISQSSCFSTIIPSTHQCQLEYDDRKKKYLQASYVFAVMWMRYRFSLGLWQWVTLEDETATLSWNSTHWIGGLRVPVTWRHGDNWKVLY